MQQTNLPIRKIALVILGLLFLWAAYEVYAYFSFSVTSTSPKVSQVATWSPFFKVEFNHKIVKQNLSLNINPDILYGHGYSINGNQLVFNLSVPMNTKQKYVITINSITDDHGQTLKNLVYSFVPKQESINQLPKDQQEALVLRNESSPVYKDPILQHLPYYSVNFDINASFPTGNNNLPSLVLNAKLFIPAAYTGSLEQQMISQDQQAVRQYINSLGLNPDNYTINYSIVSG